MKEYEEELDKAYRKRLDEYNKRIKALEIASTKSRDHGNIGDFNEGYSKALLDYKICTQEQIDKQVELKKGGN